MFTPKVALLAFAAALAGCAGQQSPGGANPALGAPLSAFALTVLADMQRRRSFDERVLGAREGG